MSENEDRPSIDVSRIETPEIPEGDFPPRYPLDDFRVYFHPEAYAKIQEHSIRDTARELCGVLVGVVKKDDFGPFAVVEDTIEGKNALNRGAQVTFTHETWAHICNEHDSRFPEKAILGWYHTHPGFGIFLSPADMFIHENFFNLPWHIAFVVDPKAGKEGVFIWRKGSPSPARQYWIGDKLRFAEANSSISISTSPMPSPASTTRIESGTPPYDKSKSGEKKGEQDEDETDRSSIAEPDNTKSTGFGGRAHHIWHLIIFAMLLVILGTLLFLPQIHDLMHHLLNGTRR